MNRFLATMAACCCAVGAMTLTAGCAAKTKSADQIDRMKTDAQNAKEDFLAQDPNLKSWFEDSYGYALFPTIGKGAVGIGGAAGEGLVYEQGEVIGNTKMTQATIGFQLGGQAYREVIFFQNKAALDQFTTGEFTFAAQVSAVAATAGASADADFDKGMAIFTVQKGGLMYEASVGGQKFSFKPISN